MRAEGLVAPLRSPITSGQEAASESSRAVIRMEVHVEVAGMSEQLGQRRGGAREMWIRDKDPVLPDIDVPIREVKVRAHRARQPPDDRTRARAGRQMVDMAEADALITLVVKDHHGLDRAVLQDLDLSESLRLRCAGRHLDVGPHLRIEDDGRNFITGDIAGEDRYVLTGNMIGIGNRPAATGDSEDGDNPTPETHTASSVWDDGYGW